MIVRVRRKVPSLKAIRWSYNPVSSCIHSLMRLVPSEIWHLDTFGALYVGMDKVNQDDWIVDENDKYTVYSNEVFHKLFEECEN